MPKLDKQQINILMFGIGLLMGFASDITAFSGGLILLTMVMLYIATN